LTSEDFDLLPLTPSSLYAFVAFFLFFGVFSKSSSIFISFAQIHPVGLEFKMQVGTLLYVWLYTINTIFK
jgi:hypothetical protein